MNDKWKSAQGKWVVVPKDSTDPTPPASQGRSVAVFVRLGMLVLAFILVVVFVGWMQNWTDAESEERGRQVALRFGRTDIDPEKVTYAWFKERFGGPGKIYTGENLMEGTQ